MRVVISLLNFVKMEGDSLGSDHYGASSHHVPSPDLFSSEDEDISSTDNLNPNALGREIEDESVGESSMAQEASKHDLACQLESARLQRLMSLLQGVPPPPSVTIPQISLNEVLQRLKDNADKVVSANEIQEPVDSLWKPSASLEVVLKTDWPEIKNIVYPDIHFNLCNASEDVEHISMKLHERFIGAETSSWCNSVTALPNSAKKRLRRSFSSTSPGCRLSHLARRRQTFSSANLAQLSSVAGSGTAGGAPAAGGSRKRVVNGVGHPQRCIMVEIKKSDKNKRIKTNSKEALNMLPMSEKASKTVAETQSSTYVTKRALFQSPEEQKNNLASSSLPAATSDGGNILRSKRALWPSSKEAEFNDNGKRVLENGESSGSQRSKVQCSEDRTAYNRATRSLPFSLSQNSGGHSASTSNHHSATNNVVSGGKLPRRISDQGPSSKDSKNLFSELSELHKRKLFWAITSALRPHGITRIHSDFTRMCSLLAFHYIEVRSNMTGPLPASTSEHMLQVVSSKAVEVIHSEKTGKSGQEENLGGGRIPKKEERSNKELFRDATASLNVRRSLCVSLSSNQQALNDKPKQTKRVPSARKSLTFDSMDPKTSSGTASDESMERSDCKQQLECKGNDAKWRVNGENVPLANAKRVSRSLFLSPKDELKTSKKDACEQTCAPESQSGCVKNCDEADAKNEEKKKNGILDMNTIEDKLLPTSSEISSVPSVSAVSSTLEADNEASRTSDATNFSEPVNSVDAPPRLTLVPGDANMIFKENGHPEKLISTGLTESLRTDSGSSECNDNLPPRILRETKERTARLTGSVPVRKSFRLSLSLSKRSSRSSSCDSNDQGKNTSHRLSQRSFSLNTTMETTDNNCVDDAQLKMEPKIVLSPLKLPSPLACAESNTTSKSTFGSPPFIVDSTTPVHSPFLGFPSKDDLNSSGEAAEESNKMPDGSSEEGNNSEPGGEKANLEEKVITPLLEAAVLESSVCVGSGSSHSTDADLSFRGRIESLKPTNDSEIEMKLDLDMNINVSANILNIDENKEKSPVLEKWAERASRSAQKSCVSPDDSIDPMGAEGPMINNQSAAPSLKQSEHPVEESMLPWDESQLEGVSQCSTNVYQKFCSIFDPSSQQGNS